MLMNLDALIKDLMENKQMDLVLKDIYASALNSTATMGQPIYDLGSYAHPVTYLPSRNYVRGKLELCDGFRTVELSFEAGTAEFKNKDGDKPLIPIEDPIKLLKEKVEGFELE